MSVPSSNTNPTDHWYGSAPAGQPGGPLREPRVPYECRVVQPRFLIRVPLVRPLSRSQMLIAAMLSEGWQHQEIAAFLGVQTQTIRFHINSARKRIPGTFDGSTRLIVWYRGGTLEVLTGKTAFTEDDPDLKLVKLAQPRTLPVEYCDEAPSQGAGGLPGELVAP